MAGPSAFRNGQVLVAHGVRHDISADGAVRSYPEQPAPLPGQREDRSPGGWSLRLPTRGATCELEFQGVALTPQDGALPMDRAVACAPASSAVLVVDRLGTEHIDSAASLWTVHPADQRGHMAVAPPTRLVGMDVGGKVRQFIPSHASASDQGVVPPATPKDRMETVSERRPFASWALGRGVEIRFGAEGAVQLTKIDTQTRRRNEFAPVGRKQVCEVGRLAFDIPTDLILAKIPGSDEVGACVAMRTGWEWPDPSVRGGARAVSIAEPRSEDPPFGPRIKPEWVRGAELEAGPTDAVGAASSIEAKISGVAGEPIIFYPFVDRLFAVGERNVVWIELGRRWHGRALD